jgi:glycosyltransferase involved in cell wall biosynthesis
LKVVAFVWDNFGPMHADRCDAVADEFGSSIKVVGLELFSTSEDYAWKSEGRQSFSKLTLFPGKNWRAVSPLKIAMGVVQSCRKNHVSDIFLCNYDQPGIFLAAMFLRALGKRVYVMGCSKFDDLERNLWREIAKRAFFIPYQAAISSGKRSRDYMRLMGVPRGRVFTEYNTLSINRIRRLAASAPAPGGVAFSDRHFTIVARFVPKKNLAVALEAYSLYFAKSSRPRPLHLCGSGPLEPALRTQAESMVGGHNVIFRGFLQTEGVAVELGATLALLLPSIEEQFGNVVIEAQAMGLPVIISDVCGARDNLVKSGKNGFVVEPDNPEGLAFFMRMIEEDETLWTRFCMEATRSAEFGDVRQFAAACSSIVNPAH